MMLQRGQNQMQRDPSDNQRPSSPSSGDNAPSPSKKPRLEGTAPFNPHAPGMMANGRPPQGLPGQQMGGPGVNVAQQMLITNGIDPTNLSQQQLQAFQRATPGMQAKSIATYSQNLTQQQMAQMPGKQMQNPGGPQGQGSPMMGQQENPGAVLGSFYNPPGEIGPGGMRQGPGGTGPTAGGSNHALQDYQMQLMLLEQQNKKRLMMARQEQDSLQGGPARPDGQALPGGPGAPAGPNGQQFQDTSPQGARTGASPNPTDMKRGTPQMNNPGVPSPHPEGGQSRGSPNPVGLMQGNMDPNMAPHYFKGMNNMDGNMVAGGQMNAGMRPPSSHPGQQFNGQMNAQQMMAGRGQQQLNGQGGPQGGQWQGGPNGNAMGGQAPQGQVQGTPQQRPMPPPSAPAAAANAKTTTASPQPSNAAPPTPQQAKGALKKKDTKAAKTKVSRRLDATACAPN